MYGLAKHETLLKPQARRGLCYLPDSINNPATDSVATINIGSDIITINNDSAAPSSAQLSSDIASLPSRLDNSVASMTREFGVYFPN
jgi:hypothetical protein